MVIQTVIGEFNQAGELVGTYRDLHSSPIPATPELVILARELGLSAAAHKRVRDAKFNEKLRNERLFKPLAKKLQVWKITHQLKPI